jgi:hypothetical protein
MSPPSRRATGSLCPAGCALPAMQHSARRVPSRVDAAYAQSERRPLEGWQLPMALTVTCALSQLAGYVRGVAPLSTRCGRLVCRQTVVFFATPQPRSSRPRSRRTT